MKIHRYTQLMEPLNRFRSGLDARERLLMGLAEALLLAVLLTTILLGS